MTNAYKRYWPVLIFILVMITGLTVYRFKDQDEEFRMSSVSPEQFSSYQHVTGVIDIHYWENTVGIPVYFVKEDSLPFVDLQVIFDAGFARDVDEMPIAHYTNFMLNQGTEKFNADQLAERLESIGAQYGASVSRDTASVRLRSLSEPKTLSTAATTLSDILAHPVFDKKILNREKNNGLTALKHEQQTPGMIAERAFYETLYDKNPYGRMVLGTDTGIKGIKPAFLKKFHETYYVQKNAKICMVGDITLAQANALSEKIVQSLEPGQAPSPLTDVKRVAKPKFKKIAFKGQQAHIMAGMPLITRDDPDYFPLVVGMHVLGSNSQSNRIFDTIRGKHGLAYSAYGTVQPLQVAGPMILSCQTRADQANKAKDLLKSLLVDFIQEGPTSDELTSAKQNLIGGYPLRFDSNRSILIQLSVMARYDYPLDYFNIYRENVDKVSTEAIQEAFKRRVDPNQLSMIMVGGAK